jgi:multiple sugar transport system substrate-binding protein
MLDSEILAMIKFLENTRTPATSGLGIETSDPYWMMTLALLGRYYQKQSITISSLANSAGGAYTTALRNIEKMEKAGLIKRRGSDYNKKHIIIEPEERLIINFRSYCLSLKTQVGSMFGLNQDDQPDFTFGGAYLAAKIIPRPRKLPQPISLKGPLRLLLKDDPTFLSLVRIKEEVARCLGVEVEIDVLKYDELYAALLENADKQSSNYDLVAVDMPWLGLLQSRSAITPIGRLAERSNLNTFDFYAAAWEGGNCNGELMGIPYAPAAELFLYRKDIFADHGLIAPSTVQEVIDAARLINDPTNGRYGVSWNAARGHAIGQTFIQVLGAFGQPPVSLRKFGENYDLNTSSELLRPKLDTEAGHAALEFLRELVRYSPPDIKDMDWYSRIEAYRSGRTAMTYEWSSQTVSFEEDTHSPSRGKTGYLPHPRGPKGKNISPMGGYIMSVPSNLSKERVEPAWRALRWLASPEMVKQLILNGSPVNLRYSVAADPEVSRADAVVRHVDALARLDQLHHWCRPAIPQMNDMTRIVGELLHDHLWDGHESKNLLREMEENLAGLFEGG